MDEKNNIFGITIETNALTDKGDGVVEFPGGLAITDSNEQRNGTRYDIKSMDISEYSGYITADHSRSIQDIIGRVLKIKKQSNKVTIGGIKFAIEENALALYAYNMLKAGYLTDFSIETIGPWPDEEGIYHDAKLIGLSAVVVGNNRSARVPNEVQAIAMNSLSEAKAAGLNTADLEKRVCYNDLGNDITKNSTTNMTDEEKKAKEEADRKAAEEKAEADKKAKEEAEAKQSTEIADIVKNALGPVVAEVKEMREAFNKSATEPKFRKAGEKSTELNGMGYKQRHAKQITAALQMFRNRDRNATETLEAINAFHLEELQKAGIVDNSVTLADFGNFVISPELLSEMEGHRSDFQPLISRTNWQETLSLQMAYLKRSGDINMQEVEMCDDGNDGNLKPISEYTASIETSNLHELAAVTPVCNAATRFLAVDLLDDVARGYRNDYDRKRAQLVIARLQQAVDETGNKETYSQTSDINALKTFINMWSRMQEEIGNGTFIFNRATYGELLRGLIGAGIGGPLSGIFTTGEVPMLLGSPYIIVPNELMPTLDTATTKTFTVEGSSVTINQAVFYADLTKFKGRTSGGLQYDLSTEAAYEQNDVVKSAFQRNELVLRGSFFRGGAFTDPDMVVGMSAPGVS